MGIGWTIRDIANHRKAFELFPGIGIKADSSASNALSDAPSSILCSMNGSEEGRFACPP